MADLDELFGPRAWAPIQDQLKRGEDPEISDIAQALRGEQPVPEEVRLYVADLLEKKKKRKRGTKANKNLGKKVRNVFLRGEVDHWKEVYHRAKRRGIKIRGGAFEVAREKVSKRTGVSEGTIDKVYYPRKNRRKNTW